MRSSVELGSEVLTIDEIARYLKVSSKTIHRMLKANEIPARRVGGQWRFMRDAILAWLDDRAVQPVEDGLVQLIADDETPVPVTRLMDPALIVMDLSGKTKREILTPMVHALADSEAAIDPEAYLASLLEREAMATTGIGPGVAFPHLRTPEKMPVSRPCVVLGICPEGLNFDALDRKKTYVLALCCSPSEIVHLRILAKLATLFRNPECIEALRSARTPQEVLSQLIQADAPRTMSL